MSDHWYSNPTQIYFACRALAFGETLNHMDVIRGVKGWRLGAIVHTLRTNYGWPIATEFRGPERIGHDFFTEKTKFWDLDDDLWLQMLNVNVYGPQLMARTVVPHMLEQGWGRIVNITTSLDTMYLAGAGCYGPSKAALEAHTKIMAQDLEDTGIGVNILIPGGPVNTRMIPEETGIPREALIQPDVMVRPIIWLSSDDSDGIHCMRFIAALWDPELHREARIEKSGAPVAWTQIESRSINPEY